MRLNHDGSICLQHDKSLKLVDQFVYVGSNISSTESVVNVHIGSAIYRLIIM